MLRAFVVLSALAPIAASASPPSLLQERLFGREVQVGAGVLGQGYGFEAGRWGDAYATQQVEARWRFGTPTIEGGILHALPVATSGAAQGFNFHLRAGLTGARYSVTVGANAQLAPAANPALALLPSVRAAYLFDGFGLSAGLFDTHGLAIARLSAELGDYGIGFVAPLGAEAHARFRFNDSFGLQVQGMVFRAFSSQVAFVTVSGVFEAATSAAGDAR